MCVAILTMSCDREAEPNEGPSTRAASRQTAIEHDGIGGSDVEDQLVTTQTDEYRPLTPEDGVRFGAYIDSMSFSFDGSRPSGLLEKFGLVTDSGEFIELDVESLAFEKGEIRTNKFGVVIADTAGPTSLSYSAKPSQIAAIRTYLASKPPSTGPSQ